MAAITVLITGAGTMGAIAATGIVAATGMGGHGTGGGWHGAGWRGGGWYGGGYGAVCRRRWVLGPYGWHWVTRCW